MIILTILIVFIVFQSLFEESRVQTISILRKSYFSFNSFMVSEQKILQIFYTSFTFLFLIPLYSIFQIIYDKSNSFSLNNSFHQESSSSTILLINKPCQLSNRQPHGILTCQQAELCRRGQQPEATLCLLREVKIRSR